MVTPIAAMAMLGIVPMTSVLYLLNAITMEAVTGVIIALCFTRDWSTKDFRICEFLESKIFMIKIPKLVKNSWSLLYLYLLKLLTFIIFEKIVLILKYNKKMLIILFFFIFISFEKYLFLNISTYFNISESVVNYAHILNNQLFFLELTNSSISKTPIHNSLVEFSTLNFINYKYLSNLSNYEIPDYLYFSNNKIYKNIKNFLLNNTVYRNSFVNFLYTENLSNPNNLLHNFLIFSENNIKHDSQFQNKKIKKNINSDTKVFGINKRFNDTGLFSNMEYDVNLNGIKSRDYSFWQSSLTDNLYNKSIPLFDPIPFKFSNYNFITNSLLKNSKHNFFDFLNNRLETELNTFYLNNRIKNKYLNDFIFNKYVTKGGSKSLKFYEYVNNFLNISKLSINFSLYKSKIYKILNNFDINYSNNSIHSFNYEFLKLNNLIIKSYIKNYSIFLKNNIYITNSWGNLSRSNNSVRVVNFNFRSWFNSYRALNIEGNLFFNNKTLNQNLINILPINIFILKPANFLEWSDKDINSITQNSSNTLPWYEESSDNLKILDKSEKYIFNNSLSVYDIVLLENSKNNNFNIKNKFKIYNIESSMDNKFIKKFKKNKKFLKHDYKRVEFKRKGKKKSPIWKLKVKWRYNLNYENLYKYLYKGTLTTFYENKIFLKRIHNLEQSVSQNSSRNNNKYISKNFNNSLQTVYSPQSKKFGLIFSDFVNNFGNFSNKMFKKDYNLVNSFSNNKIFSYKSIKSINKLTFLNYIHIFNKNISLIKNLSNKRHKNSKFIKSKNLEILKNINNSFKQNNSKFQYNAEKFKNIHLSENIELNNSLKYFWIPSDNDFEKFNLNYYDYNKKKIVNDRFLKTFYNVIKLRESYISRFRNRVDNYGIFNKKIIKYIKNSNGIFKIRNIFSKSNISFNSENFSKLKIFLNKKLVLNEDRELFSSSIRSSVNKPHTLYGLLWDEYLKQTYGFNLNFIEFNNKINNTGVIKKNKNISTISNYFQKNIENNLNIYDKNIGLTKDSEISSIITGNLLIKFGFIKEIFNLGNLDENFEKKTKRRFRKWRHYGKSIKRGGKKIFKKDRFRKHVKIKKFFKKKLLKYTIEKSKIIKKSVKYLKKYSETPVGFKYNKTPISVKLPYFKRKFWIKNEYIYTNQMMPENKNWINKKNKSFSFLNRAYFTKILKFKNLEEKRRFFGRKKRNFKKFRRLYTQSLNTFYDFNLKRRKDRTLVNRTNLKKRRKKLLFIDKSDSFFFKNQRKDNTKRQIKRTKKKEFRWRKKVKKFKKTSIRIFKKRHDFKKLRNFKLFFKVNLKMDDIIGGRLPILQGNNYMLKNFIMNTSLYKNRLHKNYGSKTIFFNPSVVSIRGGYLEAYKNIDSNFDYLYKKLLNIRNTKNIVNLWGISKSLKSSGIDSTFFENILKKNVEKSVKISSFYKLINYGKFELGGLHSNYFNFLENMDKYSPIEDFNLHKNNSYFNYNNNFIENSIIKNLKINEFSGLIDKTYENLYLYENLLISYRNSKINKKNNTNIVKKNFLIFLKHCVKLTVKFYPKNSYFKKNIVYINLNNFEKQKFLINKFNRFKVKKKFNIDVIYFINRFYLFIFIAIFSLIYSKNSRNYNKIFRILFNNTIIIFITTLIVLAYKIKINLR